MARTKSLSVGVLMLDTVFERLPGDIGHPASWDLPLLFETVSGATPEAVIFEDPAPLLAPFIRAGQKLVERGAGAITTSCGFLGLYQNELAEALPVPVATSPLLLASQVQASLREEQRVGILTFNADALSPRHYRACGVPEGTPKAGFAESSAFHDWITRGSLHDRERLADEVREATGRLMAKSQIGAIICECTNLAPFRAEIEAESAVPVHDMTSLVRALAASDGL